MNPRTATAWLLPALVAAYAFLPALGAGITPEDWGWLALTRHLDDPSVAFRENAFYTYFYRPVGIVFWWITARLFGADGWWHGVANLLLHALNAALVARLANRLAQGRDDDAPWLPGLVAGFVFACQPIGVGTAIWLSDRFDPLALCFGLAALLAGERALRRGRGATLVAVCLLPALLSKEVAYAVAAALYLRVFLHAWLGRARRYDIVVATTAAVALALILRVASDTGTQASGTQIGLGDFVAGWLAWWRGLPRALFGFAPTLSDIQVLFAVVCVAPLMAASIVAWQTRNDAATRCIAIGLVLLAAPSVLQAPIVRVAMASDAGLVPMNLRFYYLAAAGIALIATGIWLAYRHRAARIVLLVLLGVPLLPVGLTLSRDVAAAWTATYATDGARITRMASALAQHEFTPGCRIELAMPDYSDDVRTHIDLMAKGVAPRGSSLLGCAVFAGRPVFVTLADERRCSATAWPGLRIAVVNGQDSVPQPLADRYGNLCTLQFVEPDHAQAGPGIFHFSVDAQGGLAADEVKP